MSKRFTLLSFDDNSTLLSGFVELDNVSEIGVLQEYVASVSKYDKIEVVLAYLAFIEDSSKPIVDATKEELIVIDNYFEEMFEKKDVVTIDLVEFAVQGAKEDTIVENIEV